MKKLLTADYFGVQSSYSMGNAGVVAFTSIFLLACGFSNSVIGLVVALANLFNVLVQPYLADFADKNRHISLTTIVMSISVVIGLITAVLFFSHGKTWVTLTFYLLSYGVYCLLQPLINSMHNRIEERGYHLNYGLCRAGGSIGYAIVSGILGTLINNYGINMIPLATEFALLLIMAFLLLTDKHLKQVPAATHDQNNAQNRVTLTAFIKNNRNFVMLTVGVALVYFFNYILQSFLFQLIKPVGGTSADMGQMISLAAIVEVPAMMGTDYLASKFKVSTLLKFSMLGFILKNLLVLIAPNVAIFYVAQLAQMIGFALFYPSMVMFTCQQMSLGEAVKGQSLFTIMMTASGILANLVGGVILDGAGPHTLVIVSMVITLIGALVIVHYTNKVEQNHD